MIFFNQSQVLLQAILILMLVSCGKDKTSNPSSVSTPVIRDADALFSEVMTKFDLPQVGHTQTHATENFENITINGKDISCVYTDTITQTILEIDRNEDLLKIQVETIQRPDSSNPGECPIHTKDFNAYVTNNFSLQNTLDFIKQKMKRAFDPNYFCQNFENCADPKLVEVSDVMFKGINAVYVKFEYFSKLSEETVVIETYTAKEDLALNVFEEKWSYKSDDFVFYHKNHLKFSRPTQIFGPK